MTMRFFFLLLLMIPWLLVNAQDAKKPPSTQNTDWSYRETPKKNAPKERKIRYITKNKGEGLLYGNPCMVEQTRIMGFEYVIQTEGLPGTLLPWKRVVENVKTSIALSVTKSPFWKLVLNRRVKNCRKKSGDLVG